MGKVQEYKKILTRQKKQKRVSERSQLGWSPGAFRSTCSRSPKLEIHTAQKYQRERGLAPRHVLPGRRGDDFRSPYARRGERGFAGRKCICERPLPGQKAEVAGVYYIELQGGYWITDEEIQMRGPDVDFDDDATVRLIYLFLCRGVLD